MDARAWLEDVAKRYRSYKRLCERAAEQVPDAELFSAPGRQPASVGSVMKHLAGNLRSRWRDFLTTDGEKPDRDRESEFDATGETRASIGERWEAGWGVALAELAALTPEDLPRTITIRGEPLGVVSAIERNLNHLAYHAGQVVLLARAAVGEAWVSLSIPPGGSEAHDARMRERHGAPKHGTQPPRASAPHSTQAAQ